MSIHVRSKEKEIGTTVKGSFARIDKGVASGFSASNYLTLPKTFNVSDGSNWELKLNLTTGSDVSTTQYLFSKYQTSGDVGFILSMVSGKFRFHASSASSWNIASAVFGSHVIQANTTYYIKVIFNGSSYVVSYSTNDIDYVDDIVVTSSLSISTPSDYTICSEGSANSFKGSIDLLQSYININGERWWSGDSYTKVGAWIDDTVVSGFSAANYLTIDKSFDVSKGEHWEFVVKATTATLPTDGSYQVIFRGNQTEGVGFVVQILNKHLTLHCGSALVNGQFNIAQLVQSTLTIESNTTYWFRGTFNGSQYTVDVSTDEKEWVNYITVASTASIGTSTYTLGCNSPIYTTSVFTGSIDLSGCYININGSRWWSGYDYAPVLLKDVYKSTERKYYKYGTEPNATVVGSYGKIDKGVASGFSASNYLTLPEAFKPENNTWEMCFKFTTGSDVSTSQDVMGNYGNTYQNAPEINVYKGLFTLIIPKDGSSTKLVEKVGTYSVLANTSYFVKIGWTGTEYYLDYSTDGIDYTRDVSVANLTAIYQATSPFLIGMNQYAASSTNYWRGTIDLSQSYININGERWWSGKEYTKVGGWIDDGVVSGFSGTNYLELPKTFNPQSNTWEMRFKINLSNLNYQYFLGSSGSGTYGSPLAIGVGEYGNPHGKLYTMISSTSSLSKDICDARGTTVLSVNTDYWVKAEFTGSTYNIYLSTTGKFNGEETLEITANSTSSVYQATPRLGVYRDGDICFSGSIDVTQSYIKINDKMWWHGTKAIELNVSGSDVYQEWKQPVLTANGVIGGDKFAVNSIATSSSYPAYKAFDGLKSDFGAIFVKTSGYLEFYNPKPLKVSSLSVLNFAGDSYGVRSIKAGYIQARNDNEEYQTIKEFTNNVLNGGATWSIDLSDNDAKYKYYRIVATDTSYIDANAANQVAIVELTITAQQLMATGTIEDADYSEVHKKRIVVAYKTGKRKYYKLQDWKQPALTANGTIGGDSFAVNQSSTLDGVSSSGAWQAFDNTGSVSRWHSAQNLPQWISWYNPKPLKISNVQVTNRSIEGSYPNAYQLQYSDDNSTWITAVSGNGTSGDSVSWNIPVTESNAHKYWRLYVTSASGSNNSYVAIGEIGITAQEPVESTSSDYDFSLIETPQLVYNLKYDLINPTDWQAIGTISGHNFFGAGTFSEYISATREGAVTFNTPLPSGKYTWRFLHYSQVNHTFGTYKITATYEDGTTEVVYDSGLGDTAYGGGEKATIDLSLTFKKPVKVLTNYTNSWGSGSGCYGGSGNVQIFFDGSKQ